MGNFATNGSLYGRKVHQIGRSNLDPNLFFLRFRMYTIVISTLQELIRSRPDSVSHMPEALPYFVGDALTNYDRIDVGYFWFFGNLYFHFSANPYANLGQVLTCPSDLFTLSSPPQHPSTHFAIRRPSSEVVLQRCTAPVHPANCAGCSLGYGPSL